VGAPETKVTGQPGKQAVERLMYFRDNLLPVDKRTLVWIETAPDIIREKLADRGLIHVPPKQTCLELWSAYLAENTKDLKKSTLDIYILAQRRFFEFFDKDKPISTLKPNDIYDWKRYLNDDYLAESTVAATFAKTKAVFNWAVKKGWLGISPLYGIGGGSYENSENDRFIEVEEYHKLLEACPCQEWRVIITLARIGGLRCPSEVLRLRWDAIDWHKNHFKVVSPKLEHHKGKGWRYVPLFPEIKRELEALRLTYQGEEPELVINRYCCDTEQNLRTQFARIVKVAGVEKIPRPFDNMRASRATEIYAEFGEKIEEAWIGHSNKIALEHYLMVRKGDYAKAAKLELTEDTFQ
jgi:integrase